jgi:hypothetical protein
MPCATSISSAVSSVDIFFWISPKRYPKLPKDIKAISFHIHEYPLMSMDIHRYPNGAYSQLADHAPLAAPGHAGGSGWSSLGFSHAGEICCPSPSSLVRLPLQRSATPPAAWSLGYPWKYKRILKDIFLDIRLDIYLPTAEL